MSVVGPAPVIKPLSEERSWVQWFSTLGDGLVGRWGQEKRTLAKENLAEPDTEYLNYKGRELSFLFVWESGVEFTTASIKLNNSDYTMRPGMLEIWQDSTLVGGAYCAERLINLPDLGLLSGRIILQGSVFTKTTDPQRTGGA